MRRGYLIWILLLGAAAGWLIYRMTTTERVVGAAYVKYVDGQWMAASGTEYVGGGAVFSPTRTVGIWFAAFLTLCIFSFLYRDNPFYKFAESLVVGVSAAYWMVVGFWDVIVPNLLGKLWPAAMQEWALPGVSPVREEWTTWYDPPEWVLYIVPLILGVMLIWRLMPFGGWISRWPLAFIIGTTAGIRLFGYIQADFLSQIRNTVMPLVAYEDGSFRFWESFRNVVLVLSIMCCLVYFFFSIEHKGAVGRVARVGIWVLMITFGAAFGYTVMGRFALLAIRLEFLFDDWLWVIDPLGRRVGLY